MKTDQSSERIKALEEENAKLREALKSAKAVVEFTGPAVVHIVEGIQGTMEHGTWRDDHGRRLKDTNQWVAFYVTLKSASKAAREALIGGDA